MADTTTTLRSGSGPSPDLGLPAPESLGRRLVIRVVALAALLTTAVYLGWRIDRTLDWSVWWLSVPMLLLEVHAAAGLALFTFSLWDLNARPPAPRRDETDLRLAVLIPTYNESREILVSTIAAAVAVEPAHETWVLDDGNRPEVAILAARLGARYVARTDRSHAKAGNVNHALGVIEADVVAILDADHVAGPALFTSTLAYFDDPRVAVVQSPQDFYNDDSFEHEGDFQEQALFYRVLQAGKNRWGAAFWCGTGALVRVAALREVGGVATDTVTEDIHTTIRLHRRGWRTVYHNEVLARGLAAADAQQYQLQRLRWGTGAMQVLRAENPLTCSGLTVPQRLSYAATLLGWFDSWRSLGYLLVPMAVLVTGAVPIRADAGTFAVAFGATFALQRVALVLLGRGRAPQLLSAIFELVRMPANLRATLTLFGRGEHGFRVTPKGRISGERARIPAPRLLQLLLVASVATAAWFVASLAGHTTVEYEVPAAAFGAAFWLAANAGLLVVSIRRIRAERFAADRRASYRFTVSATGSLDGQACSIDDLSITGARVQVDSIPSAGARPRLHIDGVEASLLGSVRSVTTGVGGHVLGLEFAAGQEREQAELALALFHGPRPSDGPAGSGQRDAAEAARRPITVAGALVTPLVLLALLTWPGPIRRRP